ncbi:ArnT family glycosyltransferase, partial [Thermodesulfobacteriota bacterium]
MHTRGRLFAAALVCALGFCLIVNSSWNATSDSALYLSLAESLADGQGYRFNGEHHTLVPPGFPSLLAEVVRSFGDSFLAYRTAMAVMGLLTAAAGYLFLLRLVGPDAALLIGGLFGVNHVLLHFSTFTLSDVPFALFSLIGLCAALLAAWDRPRVLWTIVAGLVIAMLPVLRVNGLGFLPVVAFFLFYSWREMKPTRRILLVVLFLTLASGPWVVWQFWKTFFPPAFGEGTYFNAVTSRSLDTQLEVMLSALYGYVAEVTYAVTGLS